MPRRKVPIVPDEFYHVYNRGVNREPIFFERENYFFFLRKLRQFVVQSDRDAPSGPVTGVPQSDQDAASGLVAEGGGDRAVEIVAYCLMPNHYHLLVRPHCADFSDRMAAFGKSFAQAINKQQSRVGPLFPGPFKAIHIDREEYLLHLTRYIHLNPVEAGLVDRPADWEFSSYLEYVGARRGSLSSPEIVLREFGSAEEYRQFVEGSEPVVSKAVVELYID